MENLDECDQKYTIRKKANLSTIFFYLVYIVRFGLIDP